MLATLTLLVGFAVGGAVLFGSLHDGLVDAAAGSGPQQAAELAALAGRGPLPTTLPALDTGRLTLLQVIDPSRGVVAASASLSGRPALMDSTERRRAIRHSIDGLGAGPWLLEPTPATLGGRPELVVVVSSLHDAEASAEVVRERLAVTFVLLSIVIAASIWFVVGRALRPVDQMSNTVNDITASNLDRRVAVPSNTDEVGRLAATLNDMLDRLQRSAAAQQRFVADASHELRTPIANTRAAIEVAKMRPEATDWASVADDILVQNGRMERLTDDLLLLARAEHGEVVRRSEPVEIIDLIRSLTHHSVPADRSLTVRTAPTAVAGIVAGDADQLSRMLVNLVDNALRHARHAVSVDASVGSTSVEIRVSDDGAGIPPAERDNVFRPFVRLDSHRDRGSGGTGLGLAIARQIAVNHNGTVRIVDNQPGATFVVRLPISVSSQEATGTLQA